MQPLEAELALRQDVVTLRCSWPRMPEQRSRVTGPIWVGEREGRCRDMPEGMRQNRAAERCGGTGGQALADMNRPGFAGGWGV